MKNFIIKQGCGIGDVLFCLRITNLLYERYGKQIIWPLIPSLLWIKDYIKIPYVHFVNYDDHVLLLEKYTNSKPIKINEDTILVPLAHADAGSPKPIMESKYDSVGTDFLNWQDNIKIYRNKEKEDSLYYDVLGLKDGEEYTFIHRLYGTPDTNYSCGAMKSPFMPDSILKDKGKVVEGFIHDDYTLFDWIKVILNAKDLHLVSTSLFYIIEAMDKKLPEIKIYNRDNSSNLKQLEFLKPTLRQKWKFIY